MSLGGGNDGGNLVDVYPGPDADTLDCEPCSTSSVCPQGSLCSSVDGGEAFCFARCDASAQCEPDEGCGAAHDLGGAQLLACVPKAGACPAAVGPKEPDGAVIDHCGALLAPGVVNAGCKDCHYDCQPNGCYGGYYCNPKTKDCVRPPAQCP